ncbi:MAG TPA: amidohydrolase [Longimicrobiaceae bacterium]|nr:amidohydrolase [Longimicrobiaceae bacterium]
MKKITRGEFLGRSATVAAALGLTSLSACARDEQTAESRAGSGIAPDLILTNGNVYTVDDSQPRAEAFAVKNGRFVAVGSNEDVLNLAGPGTQVIDAAGQTVVPGFIDCHSHPAGAGLSALTMIDASQSPSISNLQGRLRQRTLETPAGEWVNANMYDDTKMQEGRKITRQDLDEVVPNHPASIRHRSGHASYYNSRALEMAGVGREVSDPAGGRFGRDASGELDGEVSGGARSVFNGIGREQEVTAADRQAGVKLIFERMAATGLTSVHDAGAGADALAAYFDAYMAGELSCRVHALVRGPFEHLAAAGIRSGFGDEWVRIGPVKYTADGAIASRTAYLSEPYIGRPNDRGIEYMTQAELNDAVDEAHANHFRVAIHANGDIPINNVLNAYERALEREARPNHRWRIEHCTLVNPQIIARIKEMGVIPAPFYTYVYWHGDKMHEYGAERLEWMFAHRSFLDAGVPVAPASDYGPGPYEPMMALQSMVTRTDFQGTTWGPSQRVSVEDALRICTMNGAYASLEENTKGSITAGKFADFVILGQDPHTVDPMQLIHIPIVRTVVDGRTVHEA